MTFVPCIRVGNNVLQVFDINVKESFAIDIEIYKEIYRNTDEPECACGTVP